MLTYSERTQDNAFALAQKHIATHTSRMHKQMTFYFTHLLIPLHILICDSTHLLDLTLNILKHLSELCKEDLTSINTLILEKLDSSVPLIQEIGKYLILSGGKRLRPLLTTSCFHILNNESANKLNHIGLAAAVEFIHAATLLHDDVVDLSKDRRGNLTANEVWGNKTSVLVGDFLFSRSFQLMTKYGTIETLKILSDTSVIISEGEVLEISNDKNLEMNQDTYFQVINGKTASLFSAACPVSYTHLTLPTKA